MTWRTERKDALWQYTAMHGQEKLEQHVEKFNKKRDQAWGSHDNPVARCGVGAVSWTPCTSPRRVQNRKLMEHIRELESEIDTLQGQLEDGDLNGGVLNCLASLT